MVPMSKFSQVHANEFVQKRSPHNVVVIIDSLRPFLLRPVLPFFDIYEHLGGFFLAGARIDIFPAKPPDHPLEDMAHLRLEMVFVVMRPTEQGRDDLRQVRAHHVDWESVDS